MTVIYNNQIVVLSSDQIIHEFIPLGEQWGF